MAGSIEDKLLRYIVPFNYALSFDEAVTKMDNELCEGIRYERDYLDRGNGAESDLYEYIRNEFKYSDISNSNKMGCSFSAMLDANNPCLQLIKDDKLFSNEPIIKSDICTLNKLGIVLGRNNVGFIWYEFILEMGDIDQLIDYQNKIKEFCRNDRTTLLWNKIEISEKNKSSITIPCNAIKEEKTIDNKVVKTSYYEPFNMGVWIANKLSFLKVKFIPERKNPYTNLGKIVRSKDISLITRDGYSYSLVNNEIKSESVEFIPDKAILFSYVCLQSESNISNQLLNEKLFYLGNGYKSSYKTVDDIEKAVFKPFANLAWYAGLEGCACIANPTNDNYEFFKSGIKSKIETDYFTLYIKGLYQSYSLLNYANRIQNELSSKQEDYLDGAEEKTVEKLVSAINLFLTKSMATSVSHISHQNDFYIYLKDRLHIHEDVKSVTSGLESLSEIQKDSIQEKEAVKSDRIQAVMGLFSLLAIVSALLDAYELLDKFFPQWELWSVLRSNPIYMVAFTVVMGVMLLISILAIIYAIKAIKGTGKGKKK